MIVIGKSNKFYTLWDVCDEVKYDEFGKYTVTHNAYIKNISFSKEEAMRKYPEASVNEDLRGHSSWTSVKRETPIEGKFTCGKYRGNNISECNDVSYLVWYWNNSASGSEQMFIEENLAKYGYKVITDKYESGSTYSRLLSPEALEELENRYNVVDEIEAKLKETNTYEFTPVTNLDDSGYLRVDDIVTMIWPDNQYTELSYNGYHYGLPLKNGKGKRIKNKNIKVEVASYEVRKSAFNAWIDITVKDFEIVK